MDNNKGRLKCAKCDFSSFWEFSLQSHFKRGHRTLRMSLFNCNLALIEKFSCPYCDYMTYVKVDFDYHLRRGHDQNNPEFIHEVQEEEWECPKCVLKTFSRFLVQSHNHIKEECKLETTTEIFDDDMKDKLQTIKEEVDLKSGDGSLSKTQTKQEFDCQITELKFMLFNCDHCSFKTKRKDNLKRHMTMRHYKSSKEIKRFICQQCPYKTNEIRSFEFHIVRKHTPDEKIKWFICAQCPYKSKLKRDLKYHVQRMHTSEKIKWFMCPQCPDKAKEKYSLEKHKTCQHQSRVELEHFKWFNCPQCPYKAIDKYSLKSHESNQHKTSDDIKWFKCEKCPYMATMEASLKLHLRKHSPEEQIAFVFVDGVLTRQK